MTDWLSLKKAADRLGVHPTTLRRWADNGDVPVYVTPGGHRRFLESDIDEIIQHGSGAENGNPEEVLASRALSATQKRLKQPTPQVKWLEVFGQKERERQRKLGQRLLGLIMQHISTPDSDERLLAEAGTFAMEYAESCAAQGLTAAQALEIVIFFRDGIVETALQAPSVANYDDEMRLKLMRRINQVFNILQVTLIKHYEQLS